jgi:hypothetical protein
MNRINRAVAHHIRVTGRGPTHIIMSWELFTRLRAECNPVEGYFVPAVPSVKMDFDKVRGLIISICSYSSDPDYLVVL